eukprot:CAMPEP_0175865708 /NCGR_PEP_ID=MMETSP0107_2-20121207/33798_1 /TAXON_ID=195067 ORGANISM="Goniomonas pacifica, Strain CCMP1869" /NCGR_SAMPLE_ID=MMETSP0107_2 /ASSEMBLY_ACC=CAM_ASM_000203 /LENGTH=50 /DNA_ID=CAMNT_0017183143 /DNA_START=259 /DNA_END=408 /DNA_ORIENTATION=+
MHLGSGGSSWCQVTDEDLQSWPERGKGREGGMGAGTGRHVDVDVEVALSV